jgi:DNA gyrase inhibitor GyrI
MSADLPRTHHQPRVEQRPPQPYVAIEARAGTEAEFRAAVDRHVPRVFGWAAEHGLRPTGGPIIRYVVVDETAVPEDGPPPSTFHLCVPLDGPADAQGEVFAGELPGGPWLVVLHRGGYAGLGAAHGLLHEWAAEEGLEVVRRPVDGGTAFGGAFEHFRIGPFEEQDPWRWETDVAYLLAAR